MKQPIIYCPGTSPVLQTASQVLLQQGICVVRQWEDCVTHILLHVPSFSPDGKPKDGSNIFDSLPRSVTVIGGNLDRVSAQGYRTLDLLKDPYYLAENASITAHCAVKVLLKALPVTLTRCPVLIIGWGRIGKCLAKLLQDLGARVTVSARKDADLALLQALGYPAIHTGHIFENLKTYRVIFNTVPAAVISPEQAALCSADCVKIELASVRGIAGEDVIQARGLPGKEAPEASGKLIAETTLRLLKEEAL